MKSDDVSILLNTPKVMECLPLIEKIFNENDLFYGHGTDNAWDEAVYLILSVLGEPYDTDKDVQDINLTEKQLKTLVSSMSKRVDQRIPLPYITHTAWFMRQPFYVDCNVLIPRSPFAELISKQFSPWMDKKNVHSILEIGTGSGCMAISAALIFRDAQVLATDISESALEVAKRNVNTYELSHRVKLVKSDVFQSVESKYDIIITNPPYVPQSEMETLPAEYAHEPRSALQADDNGLAIADKILVSAIDYLNDNGILVVEVGNSESQIMSKYPQLPFTWLDFESGGHGVFLLYKSDLVNI